MPTSKSMDIDRLAKQYIIACIDNTGYSADSPSTDSEKVSFLRETFYSEYGQTINRLGPQSALKEYYMGLPSCCTIEWRNHEILKLAEKWGSLPKDYTDTQAKNLVNNWFKFMAAKTLQLFRQYESREAEASRTA